MRNDMECRSRPDFNPRSPEGERPATAVVETGRYLFQSTLSVRRATIRKVKMLVLREFQSTLSVRRATVQLDIFVHFLRRKPAAWL